MEETVYKLRRGMSVLLRTIDNSSHNQRGILWRYGLQLPLNYDAYAELSERPAHPISRNIRRDYNFLPKNKLYHLMRLSSNLAHWFPIFEHIKYFPVVLIKFIEVYKYCPTSLFEAVATILENYCQYWFEDFPFAPSTILDYLEGIIHRNDPVLARHFQSLGTSASMVCWTLLSTFFSQVLDDRSWYILWDHILLNKCKFYLMIPLAFITMCRDTFVNLHNKQDLNILQRQFNINIGELVEMALAYTESVFNEIKFKKFTPIKRNSTYDCPKIKHSNMYLVVEDLDKISLQRSEYKLLSNELEQTKLKQITNSKICLNDDICSRKKRMQLLEEYYKNINSV